MTVVKINALEIPPQAGDEIVKRFTARMASLADVGGFEGFELLRPTSETETRWFVYTRWADQESYNAWRDGDGARNAHARGKGDDESDRGEGEGEGEGEDKGDDEAPTGPAPVSMGATLLEFEVEVSVGPSTASASTGLD